MTEPKINGFHTTVTTSNGTYKVGMTRKQAEASGSYKKFTGLDFKDLDTDNDGVLSQKEILEGRYNSAVRKQNQKRNAGLAIGFASTLAIPFTGGLSAAAATGVAALGFGYGINNCNISEEVIAAANELDRYKFAEKYTIRAEAQKQKKSINIKT